MPFKDKAKQRAAQREWARKKRAKVGQAAAKDKQRKKLQGIVFEHLKDHPCVICGRSDPILLEFDHLDRTTKHLSIANMVGRTYGEDRIRAEMAKCQVLCVICHRRKTAKQLGYYKILKQITEG